MIASLTSSMAEITPDPHDRKERINNAVNFAKAEAKYYAQRQAEELCKRMMKINCITGIWPTIKEWEKCEEDGKIIVGYLSAVEFSILYNKEFEDFEEEIWQEFLQDNKDLMVEDEYKDKDKCLIKFKNDTNYYEISFYEMKRTNCTLKKRKELDL